MVKAFQQAFGVEKANAVAREVINELAKKDGVAWAERFGDGLPALERVAQELWAGGGSLEVEVTASQESSLSFNVTRCKHAEHYKDQGLPELGFLFHCNRDFAMCGGFNSRLELERTQTIMQGATHCDFRYKLPSQSQGASHPGDTQDE